MADALQPLFINGKFMNDAEKRSKKTDTADGTSQDKVGTFKFNNGGVVGAGVFELSKNGDVDMDLKIRIKPNAAGGGGGEQPGGGGKPQTSSQGSGSSPTKAPGGGGGSSTQAPGGGGGSSTQAPGGGGGSSTQAPGGGGGSSTQAPGGGGGSSTQAPGGGGGSSTQAPGGGGGSSTQAPGGGGGSTTQAPGGGGGSSTTAPMAGGGSTTKAPSGGGNTTEAPGGSSAGGDAQKFLELHNKYRKIHDSPPMKLNDEMSKSAQAWADKLASMEKQQHSNEKDLGENLSYGCPTRTVESVVEGWYNEVCKPGYAFGGATGGATLHFTQIVWKASTELGFGSAKGTKCTYVVGRYKKRGNFGDEKDYDANVKKGSFDATSYCATVKENK
ncbi:PE-PGRS family protein PE_PGRS30 isoform X2 [Nematostella vectensis]|nr:PE-PGRS family protein PE_PGRS30 isoform X2 [Nematostella vectensis]